MKQMRFRQVLAAVLAAAMLAGCGGSAASSGSSAGGVPKPSGDALLTAENSRQPAERIREQLSVEKVVGSGGEYAEQVSIHLPELECDSADAAAIKHIGDDREGMQLSFFQLDDPVLSQIRDEILGLDINNLTPVEALNKLNEIKKILKGK